jgi:hypothetical protein
MDLDDAAQAPQLPVCLLRKSLCIRQQATSFGRPCATMFLFCWARSFHSDASDYPGLRALPNVACSSVDKDDLQCFAIKCSTP